MKKITTILVSVLIVAAIAACGASPRGGRDAYVDASDAEQAILGDSTEPRTAYVFAPLGSSDSSVAFPNATLLSNYYVNVDAIGLTIDPPTCKTPVTSLTSISFTVVVGKTTGMCGLQIVYGLPSGDVLEQNYIGVSNIYNNASAGNVTCTASAEATDGTTSPTTSTIMIQIISRSATAAWVSITEQATGESFFSTQQTFQITTTD